MLTKGALFPSPGVKTVSRETYRVKQGQGPRSLRPGPFFQAPGWVGAHLRARAHATVDADQAARPTGHGSRTRARAPGTATRWPPGTHQGARITHQATRSWVYVTRITNTGDQATQTQTRPPAPGPGSADHGHQGADQGGRHAVRGPRIRRRSAGLGGLARPPGARPGYAKFA